MKTNPEDFIQRLERITLSDDARASMRLRLSEYADVHPVMPAAPVPSPFFSTTLFFRWTASIAMLALIVTSGAGAVYGAEKAVPGDILYTVKRKVNEPIKVSLASTAEEKARVHGELAERRLEEATKLAVTAKLDEQTSAQLVEDFETATEVSSEFTTTLEEEGKVDTALALRSDLEARLSAHALILTLVAEVSGTDVTEPAHVMAKKVSEQASMAALLRAESESAVIATIERPLVMKKVTKTVEIPVEPQEEPVEVSTMAAMDTVEPVALMMAAKVAPEAASSSEVREIVEEAEALVEDDEPVQAFIRTQEAVRAATQATILEKNKDLITKLRSKVEEQTSDVTPEDSVLHKLKEEALPFLR